MRIMIAGLAASVALAFTLPAAAQQDTPKPGTAAHCKTLKTTTAKNNCLKRVKAQTTKAAPKTQAKAKTKPATKPAPVAKPDTTAAAPPQAAAPTPPPTSTVAVPPLPPLPQKTI